MKRSILFFAAAVLLGMAAAEAADRQPASHRPAPSRERPHERDHDRPDGRRAALHHAADGPHRDLGRDACPRDALSRRHAARLLQQRAGTSGARVPSPVRDERLVLRQLHEHGGQHRRGAVPRVEQPQRGGLDERRHSPDDSATVREPQRRQPPLRTRRVSLHRHGGRRVGRRSELLRAAGGLAARQAAADRREPEHRHGAVLRNPSDESLRRNGRARG